MEGEASSSQQQHEPKPLVEGDNKPNSGPLQNPSLEQQAEASGGNPRSDYYGDQRHEMRSRPNSESSAKARGKQRQRQYADYSGLDEEQVPPPLPSQKAGDDLESAYPRRDNPSSREERRRRCSARPDDYDLLAEQLPPPIPRGDEVHELQDTSRQRERRSEDSVEPPVFAARKPEDYMHKSSREKGDAPQPQTSRKLVNLYTLSHLIFFSILGTLARLGVQWLTFYPGTPIVTPVIWANFGGSFIMGFLTEDRRLFSAEWETNHNHSSSSSSSPSNRQFKRSDSLNSLERVTGAERSKIKKTIPLYVGLATGFCGSFTSFSSFARDMFLALSNNLSTPINHPYTSTSPTISSTISRNGGYSFLALLATIIATLSLSLGGLLTGAHFALLMNPITPRIPMRLGRRVLDPLMVFLGWGSWLGALLLAIFPPDRFSNPPESWRGTVLFAILFAPVGCLARFYASTLLNPLVPSFPLGTFAANMFGCAIEAMCYSIQHVGVGPLARVGGGRVGCQVLQGVQDGFCGCATTVSTWVSEINALRRRHAYVYALASALGGLALMVVIMGSVRWSVGWSSPVCVTGYPDKYVA